VHVDPLILADRGRSIAGALPLSACRRLGFWLESSDGDLSVELQFGRDEGRRRVFTGRVTGSLRLSCQRCLQAFDLPLDLPLGAVLVTSEAEADTLPEDVEAVVVDEGADMHTVDIVEDDLILALPLVPKCPETATCEPAVPVFDSEEIERQDEAAQRPFADLGGSHDHDND
jgi:uncharacterized protein